MPETRLQSKRAGGGQVQALDGGWRLSIPAGPAGHYRLAQLDDYAGLSRGDFPHSPPLTLKLRARASAAVSPGTWGFGLWNEPLSANLGFGSGRMLPALPQAAWYFFAAPQNHLSFRNGIPGSGAMAASYRSASIPTLLLAPGLLAAPLLALPAGSRLLRRLAARLVRQDALGLDPDPSAWHDYALHWSHEGVTFHLDGQEVHSSGLAPRGPLGLVIWLDNQYAAWAPDGRLGYGTLANPDAWIEIQGLAISR